MGSYLIRSAAIIAVLLGTVTNSAAGGGSFTRGCVARDMQILMMLEQHEGAKGIAAQESNEVLATIFDARMICLEGRALDALEIYDNIARRITSDRTISRRMK